MASQALECPQILQWPEDPVETPLSGVDWLVLRQQSSWHLGSDLRDLPVVSVLVLSLLTLLLAPVLF